MTEPVEYELGEVLFEWDDSRLVRARRHAEQTPVLLRIAHSDRARGADLSHFEHELRVAGPLDGGGVLRPLLIDRIEGRPTLVFQDWLGARCRPLPQGPRPIVEFLRIARAV